MLLWLRQYIISFRRWKTVSDTAKWQDGSWNFFAILYVEQIAKRWKEWKGKGWRNWFLYYFPPKVPQWRRKWHPTPVFLENHGQRSLVGCRPEGHTESDTTVRLNWTEQGLCSEKKCQRRRRTAQSRGVRVVLRTPRSPVRTKGLLNKTVGPKWSHLC